MVSNVEKFVKCVKPYHHFTTSQCLSFNRRMCGARAPLRWKRITHATHYLSIIVFGFFIQFILHIPFGFHWNSKECGSLKAHTHACSLCMVRRICNLTMRAHIFFRYRISIFDSNISALQVSCILNLKRIKTYSLVTEYIVQYF